MVARRSNTANAYEGTLTTAMAPTDLTAVVDTTSGGPASPGYLVIDPGDASKREYVYFDGTFTGTTFVTTLIGNRYLTGSAAGSGITHAVGAKVRSATTSELYTDLFDYIETVTKIGSVTAYDLLYVASVAAGVATFARQGIGTARQNLQVNSGANGYAFAASLQSLIAAAGDLIYGSGANTPAKLAAGSAYQRLRMNAAGTAPEWAGMSGVAMHKSGTLSVPGSGGTLVTWETEDYDTDNYHSGTSSTITLPFTGKYAYAYSIDWTNGATVTAGPVSLYPQLGGVAFSVGAEKVATTELLANGEHARSGGGHFTASATNTFTFVVDNTSGNSTLTVAAVSNIQVTFLGP